MKKNLLIVIFMLSLVMTLFSTAAVPKGITFNSFKYVPNKGYVALFKITGEWRQDELWGFMLLPHHRQIDMDCSFRDNTTVSCVVAGETHQFEGQWVKLVVYGYAFPVTVPTTAPARGVTFDSFSYVPSKGFVATFNIVGAWRQDELWGFVSLPNDSQIDMSCNFRDSTTVSCVIASGINLFEGKFVKLVLYGYAFPVTVPPRLDFGG